MNVRSHLVRAAAATAVVAAACVVAPSGASASSPAGQWPMFGQNSNNTAATVTGIRPDNVAKLAPKWVFTTGGDVSARAAVVGGVAYVPDWSGHLYAINAATGKSIWTKDILDDYLPQLAGSVSKIVSRTSPAVNAAGDTLYLGTQTGAYLLAVDTRTGALRWSTQLDSHPLAIDTASPSILDGVVYTGVASLEEAAAINPNYPCCSFRGSAVAVDAATGAILWQTYVIPPGYNGGAVWGSTLVPDPARHQVYVTTGNNYAAPTDPAYQACIADGGTQQSCTSPDDHFDSILALNMATGSIVWSRRFSNADDWNVACFFAGVNCPVNSGPDFDFGSGANLITVQTPQGPRTILGAGQKSGVYSALDPATGNLLWATQVGPGSSLGGMEWGSASDGSRIYVQIGNFYGIPYQLPDGTTTYAGSWAALDPLTGHIVWQVADPNGAFDLAPMTVASGVVYAASMAGDPADPTMFALDAATGQRLWSFVSGATTIAGASIAGNTVYWGSGYTNLGLPGFTGNDKLYAFTLGGR